MTLALFCTTAKVASNGLRLYSSSASIMYRKYFKERDGYIDDLLNSKARFQSISERMDYSVHSESAVKAQTRSRYITNWNGLQLMKGSEDILILQQLLWYVKPVTVVELGSGAGGSAIWIAECLKSAGVESTVYSMDIDLTLIDDQVKKKKPQNVHFLHGNCFVIEKTFPREMLERVGHPLVVIDDAHANLTGIVTYFHPFLQEDDYFVIEDTCPYAPTIDNMGLIENDQYVAKGAGKLKEMREVFQNCFDCNQYAVDSFFTDFYGYNATWNWQGYLKRMA